MSHYQRIVVAIDLSDESQDVITKARAIASSEQAELHVLHVIEPLSFAYGGDIPMDFSGIQDDIQTQAKERLSQISTQLELTPDHQHIVLGRPEAEIHALANKLDADLIVLGCHGRYGLALLMGSTANGVLHGTTCDVLAVRVGNRG